MANIIIPGQHVDPRPMAPRPASWDRYDNEMDLPTPKDPRVAAELAEYERRVSDVIESQNLDALQQKHEENLNNEKTKAQRWDGQERWQGRENEEMRLVNIIHPYTFIQRLRKAGIKADERDPYREYLRAGCTVQNLRNCSVDHPRVWLNCFTRKGRIGVNAWSWDKDLRIHEIRTITTLQYPYGPEWSIMRFNDWDVPTSEKYRGWRTALLNLICKEILTESEAHRAFGEPRGNASLFYRRQLYDHRAIRLGVAAA